MTCSTGKVATTMTIRQRHDIDLEQCVDALGLVHTTDHYPVNWPADPAAWLSPRGLVRAWVATVDDDVVGHVCLSRSRPSDVAAAVWSTRQRQSVTDTAVVSRLFVAPSARGHRFGAALLDHAVREARARTLQPVLDVVAANRAAIALYERSGWRFLTAVDQQWGPDQTVTLHCFAAP